MTQYSHHTPTGKQLEPFKKKKSTMKPPPVQVSGLRSGNSADFFCVHNFLFFADFSVVFQLNPPRQEIVTVCTDSANQSVVIVLSVGDWQLRSVRREIHKCAACLADLPFLHRMYLSRVAS